MRKVEILQGHGQGDYAVFGPEAVAVWTDDETQEEFESFVGISDEDWPKTEAVFLSDWVVNCASFDGSKPDFVIIGKRKNDFSRALFLFVLNAQEKVGLLMRPGSHSEAQEALLSDLEHCQDASCKLVLVKPEGELADRIFISPYRIEMHEGVPGVILGFPQKYRTAA